MMKTGITMHMTEKIFRYPACRATVLAEGLSERFLYSAGPCLEWHLGKRHLSSEI